MPSKYTESLLVSGSSREDVPESLSPEFDTSAEDIKGNQLLQVPVGKFTAWGSYIIPMNHGAQLELFGVHSWTDEVFYSPFGTQEEKADFF